MKKSSKNILTAFLLNFFFVIVEIVGGLLTNSIAILSDAIHDFGDCLAIGAAFLFELKSDKEPNDEYTYGYKRYSLISAVITNGILLAGGIIVIISSVSRIINPEPVNGLWMVVIAVFGVIINGAAVLKTHKSENINERSINLHMLEDVLGWTVVLIGSVFIAIFEVPIIDPILSILVTIFIFYNVVKNIIDVCSIILEKAPRSFVMDDYKKALKAVDGLIDAHHIHVWSIDGSCLIATIHGVVDKNASTETIEMVKHEIAEVSEEFNIRHITIQIDIEDLECESGTCNISELGDGDEHHHHHH